MFATGIEHHFEVKSAIQDVAIRWKSLGGALGLHPPVLDRVEKERHDDMRSCLSQIVTEWLNESYNTERFGLSSWKMLVEAVAHRSGGNNHALARQLASDYRV